MHICHALYASEIDMLAYLYGTFQYQTEKFKLYLLSSICLYFSKVMQMRGSFVFKHKSYCSSNDCMVFCQKGQLC